MGRHFRFLLILLFYGLLPALLVTEGSRAWLEQRFDSETQERRDRMQNVLQGLREDIVRQRPRDRLVFAIRDELGRTSELTLQAVESLQARLDRQYPGLVRLVCLTAPELNDGLGVGQQKTPGNFQVIGPEGVKYRTVYQYFSRYLDLEFNGNYRESNRMAKQQSARMKMIRRVIGERLEPKYIAGHRSRFHRVLFEGKPAWFSWDYVVDSHRRDYWRRALLMTYVFEDAYRRIFRPAALLAPLRLTHSDLSFGLVDATDDAAVAALQSVAASLPSLVGRVRRHQEEGQERDRLIVVSPVGGGDRSVFYAVSSLETLRRENDSLLQWIRALTLLVFFAFLVVTALIHYKILRLYVSIRFQLAALFLLAALIPLCAIFYLGYQHVMKSRLDLRADHRAVIRNQVRSVEDLMADAKQNLLALGLELRDAPWLKEAFSALPVPQEKTALKRRIRRHFSIPEIDGNREGMLEDVLLFNCTGELILSAMDRPRGILTEVLKGLSRDLLRESCLSRGIPYPLPDAADGMIGSLVKSIDNTIMATLLHNREVIHKLDVFGGRIHFLFEPVFDDQVPLGTLVVIYDINDFGKVSLKRIIDDNWRQVRAQQAAGRSFVAFVSGHAQYEYRKFPGEQVFTDSLQAMLRRIIDDAQPREGMVSLRWAQGSEEAMLAWGSPLKEIPDYVLIGLTPLRFMDEEYNRKLYFYILVFLLAMLVALAIALVISVKFIHPVRLVQRGVRAITEGDLQYRMRIDSLDELGDLAQTFNRMVAGLQEKERMSRYVSEFVLDEVKKEDNDGEGEEKKATILFADIRDFTTLSETHPPALIVRLLNEYLERMTGVIRRNGGVVDKFIGDAIMAVFYPDHPRGAREDETRAVVTALQMRDELARFNAERRMLGWFEIENGIGINTGEVIRGNIGARDYRVDFTVIGDHVNIAARLESASKQGKFTRIVISETTWQAVRNLIVAERMSESRVKGKSHDVVMYEVVGLRRLDDYLPMLQAADASSRIQGLRLAAVLDDPALVPYALEQLASPEQAVRLEAAFALARFPANERVTQALSAALDHEKDETIRATLIKLIGEAGSDQDRIALQRFLGDENPRVRANAIEAIGRARDRAAVIDTLRSYVTDPNNRIRANACVMLWSLGDTGGLDQLLEMSARPEALMRASGAWGIGEIATREKIAELRLASGSADELIRPEFFARLDAAVEALHRLLDDADLMVQRNAIKGLGKVGNRRSVHHLIRKYQECTDDEMRMIILAALDEIGSYHIVRQLREEKRR